MAELDVRERVADHEAGGGLDVGEVGERLLVEAGTGLAAVAFVLIVRTEVKGVDVRAGCREGALQFSVDGVDVGGSVEAECDAALVGDDDDAQPGAVEARD